jgi:hypothetical protein
MRARSVEIPDVLCDHPAQLPVTENQKVIEAFPSYAPHESLTDRSGFRRVILRFQDFNSASCCHSRKSLPVFAIAIANQEAWSLTEWRGFAHLLCDPGISRMSCDIEMNNAPGSDPITQPPAALTASLAARARFTVSLTLRRPWSVNLNRVTAVCMSSSS